MTTQLTVIGAGPGGYAAAFLGADLGMSVTLIDPAPNPGGVCLFRGCIPSKALLHVAKIVSEAREAKRWGVSFGEPLIDPARVTAWKDEIVGRLTGGLGQLSKQRKINFVQGTARFAGGNRLLIETAGGETSEVAYENVVIATGSRPAVIPGIPESPHILDSTSALNIAAIPKTMLIIGGGYIGLELGTVYAALGTRVQVVEMMPSLLPGADKDLVQFLSRSCAERFEKIMTETKVLSVTARGDSIHVRFESKDGSLSDSLFDKVLVSVGRKPNTAGLGLEKTSVKVTERGFVIVDEKRRTADPHIYAIGDITGDPMLAHKASHEGRVAVEAIAGHRGAAWRPKAVPAVIFTDPELAWCGITEREAAASGQKIRVARFPWAASGRAMTLDRDDGMTKVLADDEGTVVGVGIVGPGAGELIAEGVLAVEMGASIEDLKMCIHPHPTLSETVMEAAEVFFGQSTHIYRPAGR